MKKYEITLKNLNDQKLLTKSLEEQNNFLQNEVSKL